MKRFIKSAIACIAAVAMIATVAPVTTYAASQKTVTVTNQKQLEAAIKNGATKITIKTAKNVKITIPASKKAAKVEFVVNAKNATVTNKASVKSLTVKDAKAFTESGKNNDIKIATDKKLTVTVAKSAKGADIQVAAEGADVKIVANGEVSSVAVAKSDANVVIKGTSDNKIDVTVSKPGAKVSTSVPVAVTADRKTTLVIGKGADGSTVTANASIKVAVAKEVTVDKVEVKVDADVDLIAKGTVSDVTVAKEAEGAKLNINASGKVENVTVDAKADVAVKGTTTETVKVTVNAADTTVKAETAVDTTLNADAKVDLGSGAEGSKVTTGSEDVKADVSNGTSESITITDSTGKDTTVDAGKSENTADTGKTEDKKDETTTGGGSTSSGSSSSSGSGSNPGGGSTVDVDAFVEDASVYVLYEQQAKGAQITDKVEVTGGNSLYKKRTISELKNDIKMAGKQCKDLSVCEAGQQVTAKNSKTVSVDGKNMTIIKKRDGDQREIYVIQWDGYVALVTPRTDLNKIFIYIPKESKNLQLTVKVNGNELPKPSN